MAQLDKLEMMLDDVFNKKAPVNIPPEGRKGIAEYLWIISLVFGIIQLYAAVLLWQAGHVLDRAADVYNYYTGMQIAPHLGPFYYLSLLAMVGVGVMMLLAVPHLKNKKKEGWNILFYVVLLEALVAVLRLLSSVGGGFMEFLGGAVTAAIGAYLLFQVRECFVMSRMSEHKPEKEVKETKTKK